MIRSQTDLWVVRLGALGTLFLLGAGVALWAEQGSTIWLTRLITGLANCF